MRAKKFLGWKPSMPSIEHEIPSILKQEKEVIGEGAKHDEAAATRQKEAQRWQEGQK